MSSFTSHINSSVLYKYSVLMAYHPKSNHSSHCHHSSHTDHIFSLCMFLPHPATKQEQRANPEFKGFSPHQQYMLQSDSQLKNTVAETLIINFQQLPFPSQTFHKTYLWTG